MEPINLIIYCLIAGAFMPLLSKAPLALAMKQAGGGELGGYDNKHPREQQSQLTGFGARCLAAHQNSFEAMIFFAPAALLAIATNTINETSALLCGIWVISRLCYLVCYWVNWDVLRSSVWGVGIVCNFYLYFSCLS